jgi:putative transposase
MRLKRLYVPGYCHHIIQRGNNRQVCFFEDTDRERYLELLGEASKDHGVAIHAYVLMSNHVHILVTPEDKQGCGKMMQSLGRCYVRYFNDTYQRSGTLWEGRYKSTVVDSDAYFFTVSKYIELNPVRANMISDPREYRWSSYPATALGEENSLLTRNPLYLSLGSTPAARQAGYRAMFDECIPEYVLMKLRAATNKGWAFGEGDFLERIAPLANRAAQSAGWGGVRRSGTRSQDQGI